MEIISRSYDPNTDFDLACTFLITLYEITTSFQYWLPVRFENSHIDRIEDVRIWEKHMNDDSVEIVAITSSDSPNAFYIHTHPKYKYLEREIIEWIEHHFTSTRKELDKPKKLFLFSMQGDTERENLLTDLGYIKQGIIGIHRSRSVDIPIPEVKVPEGFTIRNIQGKTDYEQLAETIRIIFGHGEWFNAEVLEKISRCSFYKEELDLVAVAPDGTFASICTFRMDPFGKMATVEPMGTHPKYRKLGLGKILIYEGLKRAMKYNPTLFYIDSAANSPAANKFYDSVGFTGDLAEFYWRKEF
ncbi:MAG: GNAT family N-acetyltransferase [Candidatus Hodarchaeota archaeon]